MDLSVIFQRAFVAQWNFHIFRINQAGTGQFERTYLLPMKAVMYVLRGCTAPSRDENQLRGSSRINALDDAEIKYSTVQNWYPGKRR
jgi:Fe-S cluster assembly protein SufB